MVPTVLDHLLQTKKGAGRTRWDPLFLHSARPLIATHASAEFPSARKSSQEQAVCAARLEADEVRICLCDNFSNRVHSGAEIPRLEPHIESENPERVRHLCNSLRGLVRGDDE